MFSETSSSSGDEWESVLVTTDKPKTKFRPRLLNHCKQMTNSYSEQEFKNHFRMTKDTFQFIDSLIHEDLTRTAPGCPMIPSHEQLMIALWKMVTEDSYRSVCERFNIARATAVRSVRRVTTALVKKGPLFIRWPDRNYAQTVMEQFEESSGFPGVLGIIDGTHIKIDPPKENSTDYFNSKGYHSIQLQIVCDYKMRITHCHVGHPGSVHDQEVFQLSGVAGYLNDEKKFPDNSHLLGDAAYELHEKLLTPFQDNGHLNAAQKNYNNRHALACAVVGRCIGMLKGRMRSLLHCLPIQKVDLMAEYVEACCVIHNICTLKGDFMNVVVIPPAQETNDNSQMDWQINCNTAVRKRNEVMEMLPR